MAQSENDLYRQLQTAGLELIDCSAIREQSDSGIASFFAPKIVLRDLIQFFVQMEQMQSAGVPLLESLGDIRDTSEKDVFRDLLTEVHRDVSDGTSLSEAIAKHPKIFKPLYVSLVAAGEETGDLTSSYLQLVKYLKWVDAIQGKIRKATRYPLIVTLVVLGAIIFLMTMVVPQIVGFLQFLDLELPWFSVWLIATTNFFVKPQFDILGLPIYGSYIVIAVPILIFLLLKFLRKSSSSFAYNLDKFYVSAPVIGPIIRKISIARYAQTFGALYASGISILNALKSARETVTNLVMVEAMEAVEVHIREGDPLSKAFNASGEFPSMVVRMLKVGEESGNLTPVLDQVSEFYTADVNEAIDGLIEMIQPTLTAILGLVIAWIAAGSLGPIYMNLGNFL